MPEKTVRHDNKLAEPSSKRTVLVIEDEHQVRTLVVLMLEKAGYGVLEAAYPNEAASVWRQHSASVDIIVADIWLPGISGPELVGFFQRERPAVRAVFISGMNPEIQPELRKLTRGSEILKKPFTPEEFLAAVERALVP